jgi:hypothetical protein
LQPHLLWQGSGVSKTSAGVDNSSNETTERKFSSFIFSCRAWADPCGTAHLQCTHTHTHTEPGPGPGALPSNSRFFKSFSKPTRSVLPVCATRVLWPVRALSFRVGDMTCVSTDFHCTFRRGLIERCDILANKVAAFLHATSW